MKKVVVCLLFVAISCLSAVAQAPTSMTYSLTISDGTTSTCVNHNCWFPMGSGNYSGISASWDSAVVVWDSNGAIYHWDTSTRSWVKYSSLPTVMSQSDTVTLQDANDLYPVRVDGTCGAGGAVVKANSNFTGWTDVGGCSNHLQVAADGTLITCCGDVWFKPPGGSFTQIQGSSWQETAVVDKTRAYGRINNTLYSIDFTNSGTYTLVPNQPTGEPMGDIATNSFGEIWAVDFNGTPYFAGDKGGSFTSLPGFSYYLSSGATPLTFKIGANGQPYHFNNAIFEANTNITSNYTTFCNNHPNTCPTSTNPHTLTSHASFTNGLNGIGPVSVQGSPFGTINASSWDAADPSLCDLSFGDGNSPSCKPVIFGKLVCVAMGVLFNQIFSGVTLTKNVAITWAAWNGSTTEDPINNEYNCEVFNYCSNTQTTPALCDAVHVGIGEFPDETQTEKDDVCRAESPWKEVIPYERITIGGLPVNLCFGFKHAAGIAQSHHEVTTPMPCTLSY